MPKAWLFPGHGSQYIGMGHVLFGTTAIGKAWLARAECVSSSALLATLKRGPHQALTRPGVLEPLLAALSCAYVDFVKASGHQADHVAGYSAGELPAMYAAGVLDADTVMHIACIRGRALELVLDKVSGGMLAIGGIGRAEIEQVVAAVTADGAALHLSAVNGVRHFTLSGSHDGLAAARRLMRHGGASVGTLDAAGPWHSPALADAAADIAAQIEALAFVAPQVPVWLGSSGSACHAVSALKRSIAESLVLPVLWEPVMDGLLHIGVRRFLELGPGCVLYGLLGQSAPPGIQRGYLERRGSSRLRLPLN